MADKRAGRGDTYSRLVNTLKVLLPLGALALLSTLFFFSGKVDPTQSIPYAELNIDELAREQRVGAPYFAGVTEDGTAVTLTGEAAIPDKENPARFAIQNLSARFEGDLTLDITAAAADVRGDEGNVTLSGGTKLATSDGLIVETEGLIASLRTGALETLGPIAAVGPFGRMTANRMTVSRSGPNAEQQMNFQGEVNLIYEQK